MDYANLVENSKNTSKPSTASSDYSVSKTAALKPTSKGILEREKDILMKSSIELKEFTNRGIKLRYKKDRYLKSIDQALVAFDQKIENLAKEKILLAGGLLN